MNTNLVYENPMSGKNIEMSGTSICLMLWYSIYSDQAASRVIPAFDQSFLNATLLQYA